MIFPKSNRIPNRSVRYASVSFHQNNIALKSKNTILKDIPKTLVVRGGGNTTYKIDVAKNHVTVGMSVYAHPKARLDAFPTPPTMVPISHNAITVTKNPKIAAA